MHFIKLRAIERLKKKQPVKKKGGRKKKVVATNVEPIVAPIDNAPVVEPVVEPVVKKSSS